MWMYWRSEMKETFTLILIFLALLYQTEAAGSNCTVDDCNSDFCVGNNCTKCNDPYFLHSQGCSQCYLHCRTCNGNTCYRCINSGCKHACEIADCPLSCSALENTGCFNCPDGFYGYGASCYSCLHTGCKCSSSTNCINCLPGKYDTASNCENDCPSECITCNSINNCSQCVLGKYGPACASDCISRCQNGSCDKDSGSCPSGCRADQYLDSNKVCRACRFRCSSCINNSQCTSCKKAYYWGQVCEYDCGGCYNNCNRTIGCSSNCLDGYYQTYNVGKHGFECIRCPANCLTCIYSDDCATCDNGFWGNYCQHNCSGCRSECSKSTGCGTKCVSGYYSDAVDTGYVCKQCSDYCENCSTYNTCHVCQSGYFVGPNGNCALCPANCRHPPCVKTDGTCIGGCIDGLTGSQCNQKCPVSCLKCGQFNMSICGTCKIDFYGVSCKNSCSINCNPSNGQTTCTKANGSCIFGCKNGYWGSKCENECSEHCASSSKTTRRCNVTSGECHNGCLNGRYGEHCTMACNENCVGGTCFQHNGTCTKHYIDTCTTVKESSTRNATVTAMSVLAGSVVLLAVLAIAGVVILLKRGRLVFIRKKSIASSSVSQDQELHQNNTY